MIEKSTTDNKVKSRRKQAIVIGVGLALSPIHNRWLTDLVTNHGEVGFFLPAFGTALWLMGALLFVTWDWHGWKSMDWGDKRVLVALVVIAASIGVSGIITGDSWKDKTSPLLMGISLLAVYLASRKLGSDIFLAFIPLVVVGAVIAVIGGMLNPGVPAGGLITNYCASVGFLVIGMVSNRGRWQWLLVATALVGIFFIGALEAVFIVAVLGIAVLVRRDFSHRFLITAVIIVVLAGIWGTLGHLVPLYEGNRNLAAATSALSGDTMITTDVLNNITTDRWGIILSALKDTSVVGHGYSLSTVGRNMVHNIPTIVLHQVGPLAAVAWLVVTLFCLVKTRWKYAWIAVLAMSVFDHYLWTQFTPYWWALAGVSLADRSGKPDFIFRKVS